MAAGPQAFGDGGGTVAEGGDETQPGQDHGALARGGIHLDARARRT
jgi:hypothetical protein